MADAVAGQRDRVEELAVLGVHEEPGELDERHDLSGGQHQQPQGQ